MSCSYFLCPLGRGEETTATSKHRPTAPPQPGIGYLASNFRATTVPYQLLAHHATRINIFSPTNSFPSCYIFPYYCNRLYYNKNRRRSIHDHTRQFIAPSFSLCKVQKVPALSLLASKRGISHFRPAQARHRPGGPYATTSRAHQNHVRHEQHLEATGYAYDVCLPPHPITLRQPETWLNGLHKTSRGKFLRPEIRS